MGQNKFNSVGKVLEVLFENMPKKFTVREISSQTKIPKSTVHKILGQLRDKGLINKDNSSKNNLQFHVRKINHFTEKIVDSGLIDGIIKDFNPSLIILFGSIRKGESTRDSDIDIFIESNLRKDIDLSRYEKKLGHKIQLLIESRIQEVHNNLFNNIINGIKLYGSLKLK